MHANNDDIDVAAVGQQKVGGWQDGGGVCARNVESQSSTDAGRTRRGNTDNDDTLRSVRRDEGPGSGIKWMAR